jgi:pimeloyl-ACP methyl ester carboxylesterase
MPLLLVHGFPLDARMWRAQVAALGGAGEVLAPDLPGHGRASKMKPCRSMDEMARYLAGVLDQRSIDAVDLGGLSMGGYVCFAFWRLYPKRVRRLALIDTRPGADSEQGRRGRDELAARVREEGAQAAAQAMLDKMLTPAAPAGLRREVETWMLEQPREALAIDLEAMKQRPDSTPDLAGIAVPTLVLVGDGDEVTPPSVAREMANAIPGSRLAVIPGAAHLGPVQQPQAVNAALREHLSP